jgi:PAS domain S-box-containing protein
LNETTIKKTKTRKDLLQELVELTARLEKAEETIREIRSGEHEKAKLEAAVAAAVDAVVITDSEGIVRYVNPAFETITGYKKEEVEGKMLPSFDPENSGAAALESLMAGRPWSGVLRRTRKDETVYQEENTIAPVRNASGRVTNFVAIKRDITEKLGMEAAAQAVNTMNNIGYVFSGIRHEMGNPVNSLKMILTVLRSRMRDFSRETVMEYVERAIQEVSKLEYLLTALKNFNMYEVPELKVFPAGPFLENLVALISAEFNKKGVKISADLLPGAELVHADPRALQQVLLNVLTNALDALQGAPEPEISIKVMHIGKTVLFRIWDNGKGLSEKERKQLFTPFYTTKEHGTGLGLVIARKMLLKMGGSIELSSQAGSGTVADVFVPGGSSEIQG